MKSLSIDTKIEIHSYIVVFYQTIHNGVIPLYNFEPFSSEKINLPQF